MNISDLQTMDFVLKSAVLSRNPYKDSDIKLLLKCDNFLVYGDLVRLQDDYVYESYYSPNRLRIEHELIGFTQKSDRTQQIDNFQKISPYQASETFQNFIAFVSNKKNLEVLSNLLIRVVNDLDGVNNLPRVLYNASLFNSETNSVIPVMNLEAFSSVEFVSFIEVSEN